MKSLPVKNDNRFVRLLCVLAVVLGVSGDASLFGRAASATQTTQSTSTKTRLQDRTFKSESLDRVMKYRVWVPAGYFSGTKKYPVLYLLHGWAGDETNWSTLTKLAKYAEDLPVIVVMPDAGNSWYVNSGSFAQNKFEAYLVHDLVAEVDQNWRTVPIREGRAIAGLSMGGYGALKEALKHPEMFQVAASLSGAFNAASPELARERSDLRQSLDEAFGPERSEAREKNDLYALAQKADTKATPYLYVDCGNQDETFLPPNRKLVSILSQRKFAYEYHEFPGEHSWQYWDERLPAVLNLVRQELVKE
jgi:S-formylglutathione hydrolase FrmB